MGRILSSGTRLENLKREAKRWLKSLRSGDAAARSRFAEAHPSAPAEPGLREVQHALAREYGYSGWAALKAALAELEAAAGGDARQLVVWEFFEHCGRGEVAEVAAMLDREPDLVHARESARGETGRRTALHYGSGHADIVALLLARGADPNVRDDGDNAMPLHFAAEREDLEVIRLLIEAGADPIGAEDWHGLEVIGWATVFGQGRPDVVDYLLRHGARHNIFSAVATGAVDAIRTAIAATPTDVDRVMDPPNQHRRPLHLAVVKRRAESLAVLLELGADVEGLDGAGLTALDQAAMSGETVMAEMLLAQGARLRLPAAVALNRPADVSRLLREDPDCLKPGHRWGTLIIRASERASGEMIETLIAAGADVNVRDSTTTSVDGTEHYTPLHAAAFHGNVGAARVLLERGADPNIRDSKYCGAPAGWADYAGHPDARDLILAGGIDLFQALQFRRIDRVAEIAQRSPWQLNHKTFSELATCVPDGQNPEPWHTPLAWAVVHGYVDGVRALLEQGALQKLAPDGRTLQEIAREAGHAEVVQLLERHERVESTADGRLRWFVKNACPDHDIRGATEHITASRTAERLLRRHPELAQSDFVTAVICGDVAAIERALAERPSRARENSGPKGWTALLYLCFTRLPSVAGASDNAVTIARLLLDHGADPNAYFMAGGSRYTPLVGAMGEGEESRPAHPRRDTLVRLLLERGANPYDIQVLYNTHFQGKVLWFLELIHAETMRRGRQADWADPAWHMMDMGGYGTGSRFLLEVAIRQNDLQLAEWLLAHGASPNATATSHPRWAGLPPYEAAVQMGRHEIAELLRRHGATPTAGEPLTDPETAFVAACLRLDAEAVRAQLQAHPEYLKSPRAIIAAAEQDRADVVEFLLELGTSIEIENEQKQRPLHAAAWSNALHTAELLIARGAEIDPRENEWQNTPLDFAVYAQHPGMIDLLSRHSRDIWNLVYAGKVERVREVLRERPELARLVTRSGETPLTWLPEDEAAAAEIVRLFLEHGADPAVRSADGLTAADYASRRLLVEAASLLRAAGG